MASSVPDKGATSYKNTLNLPTTSFSLTANAAHNDPVMLERWQQDDLYNKATRLNEGNTKFILHDGPPYANGPLHLGHAYNKIVKDIIAKSQRMMGNHVPLKPGWDCHGLPIEQKVNQTIDPHASALQVRQACRSYATQWIQIQKEQFKKLGVLMDWDHPYLTMNPDYEANIVRAFGIFFAKGYVEKKLKTVPWCPTDQTVLAAAEIEYQEKKDPSAYVLFTLTQASQKIFGAGYTDRPIHAVIWTTTPWTLPLNRALLFNPTASYALVAWNNAYLLLGADLVASLAKILETPLEVACTITPDLFSNLQAQHPLSSFITPFIADPLVETTQGTALVHCAPGCGPHDYELGIAHGLEIFCPVNPAGLYTLGVEPAELVGTAVSQGQFWVLKKLQETEKLLAKKILPIPILIAGAVAIL